MVKSKFSMIPATHDLFVARHSTLTHGRVHFCADHDVGSLFATCLLFAEGTTLKEETRRRVKSELRTIDTVGEEAPETAESGYQSRDLTHPPRVSAG